MDAFGRGRCLPRPGLAWLIVESIRSPGNLGTILRTAEACGVGGLIVLGAGCDPFDQRVIRASMGGFFHVPVVRANIDQLVAWKRRHGVQLVGLSPTATRVWTELPSDARIALVLGHERAGLSDAQHALCDAMVRLPMIGRADSLNVSIAAGVVMYELVRRTLDQQPRNLP